MSKFYAKSTGGFYTSEIHGPIIPSDAVSIADAEHTALMDGQSSGKRIISDAKGNPVLQDAPLLTASEMQASLTAAVQHHLDSTAQTRGYDGILSLCSYASSTNPKFSSEALAGVIWRDAVWMAGYAIQAAVTAGTRAIPGESELLAALPAMAWPAPQP